MDSPWEWMQVLLEPMLANTRPSSFFQRDAAGISPVRIPRKELRVEISAVITDRGKSSCINFLITFKWTSNAARLSQGEKYTSMTTVTSIRPPPILHSLGRRTVEAWWLLSK